MQVFNRAKIWGKGLFCLVLLLCFVGFFTQHSNAATGINHTINFQGKLVNPDGTNVTDGSYSIVFSLYTVSSGGSAAWTETDSVTAKDGVFRVSLGAGTSFSSASIDFNSDTYYLGIKVGTDAEMTPRVQFTAVPYAFNAEKVNGLTVTNNGTNTLNIAAGKTLIANSSLTLAGTDNKTLTVTGSTTLADNIITFGGTETLTLAATKNVSFADAFTTSGANPLTLTTTGTTNATLPSGTITLVDLASTQTLSTKTLDNTNILTIKDSNFTLQDDGDTNKRLAFQLSGITTGNTRTLTIPDASGTICLQSSASCGFALGTNYWQLSGTTISPATQTNGFAVGTNTRLAGSDLRSLLGTQATASVSGATSFAGLVVDNSGVGDIFTASSSGLNRFVIKQNGNVGIGTTTPGGKLEVDGVTYLNNENANQLTFNEPGSNVGNFYGDNSNNRLYFGASVGTGTVPTTPIMSWDLANNNVGIGTTAPANNLDIRDATNANTATLLSIGNATSGIFGTLGLKRTAADSGAPFVISGSSGDDLTLGANNTEFMRILGVVNGNSPIGSVGIGTTTPLARLDLRAVNGILPVASVSGKTSFASFVVDNSGVGDIFTASSSGLPRFTISQTGNISDTTASTVNFSGAALTVSSCSGCTSSMNFANITSGTNTAAAMVVGTGASLNFSGSGSINASQLLGGTWAVPGTIGSTTPNTGAFTTLSANNGASDLTLTGTTPTINFGGSGLAKIVTASNQNLAIDPAGTGNIILNGSVTPLASLDLRANSGTLAIASVSGATSFAGLVVDNSGVGDLFTASSSGLNRFVINQNGNVGIGITNATSQLSIYNPNAGYSTLSLSSSNGAGDKILLGDSNAYDGAIAYDDTHGQWMEFRTGGTTSSNNRLVIDNNGNVGIGTGTTTPTATLNLLGSSIFKAVSDSTTAFQFLDSTGGTALDVDTTNDNVGVGRSSPGAKLDVSTSAFITLRLNQNGSSDLMQLQSNGTTVSKFTDIGALGINTGSNSLLAALDTRSLSGTQPTASISGATSFAGLVVDNSGKGDLFTASSSGTTRFTVQQNGAVVIGSSTNGLTFDPVNAGPTYSGTGRPTKQVVLSPEYAGAILTASGSASTNGNMTSDASPSANFRNYYQWKSSQSSLQDYTVAVRTTLPKDFSSWVTSGNAISVDLYTNLKANGSNKIDIVAYKVSDGSVVVVDQGQSSSATDKTWITRGYTSSQVQSLSAGDTVVFYLKMYSKDNNDVLVGDIVLNYLAKF